MTTLVNPTKIKTDTTHNTEKESEMLRIIRELGLSPHPEGGFYRQTYRSEEIVSDRAFASAPFVGQRQLASSIYYLLPSDEVSRFHRLKSDELWYYHYGSPLTIHMITPSGVWKRVKLGPNILQGETLQAVIPKGTIFGATVNDNHSYSLVGCMVTPGFEFQDFELMKQEDLLMRYPQYRPLITLLTPSNQTNTIQKERLES